MSGQTYADDDDLAFEQRLLGAGLAEVLPRERTEAALLRFTASVAALQGAAVGAAVSSSAIASASAGFWSRRLLAAKWLTLGVLVGGVTTFAWVQRTAPQPVVAPNAVALPNQATTARQSMPAAPSIVAVVPIHEPARPATTEGQRKARPAAPSSTTPRPASDLAAEVAALDGIRTALAIGAWQSAEQQLTRYRRNFAHGALRSEGEVLWLETLLAQGNRPAATAAAERFIAEHPRDPQVARVRALIE